MLPKSEVLCLNPVAVRLLKIKLLAFSLTVNSFTLEQLIILLFHCAVVRLNDRIHTSYEHNAWHIHNIKNILEFLRFSDFPQLWNGNVYEWFSRSGSVQVLSVFSFALLHPSLLSLKALIPGSGLH